MDSITLWFYRTILAFILFVVILISGRGIWLLFRPSTEVQVRPFDIISEDKIEKSQGEIIARMLAAKMRQIDRILTTDPDYLVQLSTSNLSDTSSSSEIKADILAKPITEKAVKLNPSVRNQLTVEFRPFNVDIIGIMNLVNELLHDGPVLRGAIKTNDQGNEIFVTAAIDHNKHRVKTWSAKNISIDQAITKLAHHIVLDFQIKDNPELSYFDSVEDFQNFVTAVSDYHLYLQYRGLQPAKPSDRYLGKALNILKSLSNKDSSPAIVFSYLGSTYMFLAQEEQARLAFFQEVELSLDAQDRSEAEKRLNSIPEPDFLVQTIADLAKQPALENINLSQAINQSGSNPVTIAILADGISSSLQSKLGDRILEGKSFIPNETITDSNLDHGTQVTALVAAIAPKAKILTVKVLGKDGSGAGSGILAGIEYARTKQVDILLMPISGGTSQTYKILLNKVKESNILPIAASGNQGNDQENFPGSIANVLAVAATNNQGKLADFSSYGAWVSLAAPGVDIISMGREGETKTAFSGTSFSAAVASGVAALMLSVNPDLTPDAIEKILQETSTKQSELKSKIASGQIDALAAVLKAKNRK